MQCEQVRNMAVAGLRRIEIPVLAPLHQLTAAADLRRADLPAGGVQLPPERSSSPRTWAAIAVLFKSSQMICRSIAAPSHTHHARPPAPSRKLFSGDVDGDVMSPPFSSSTNM